MAPVQEGVLCTLVPGETEVWIGIDYKQERVHDALLHAYAHVLLDHVRPGDTYGHWDTSETLGSERSHRRWDREVRESFAPWFEDQAKRQVASLDDCNPLEKAQLGLWRMIGDMLGESRRLHAVAERYQHAAYQRQAAQRMVAMLEDYGGAMLCDGVGLGKTYVATTLMVHYANSWKDQHTKDPDTARTDPFRITVLSPNSVVSTWRREAITPLAAHGVPLSTVRVISHTKLSRITRASDLLQPGPRRTLSDLEHLLLSDLVIVDEAHNFRAMSARRTKVLRDLLRLQPRKDLRRRVALLTATPINNSLEDLRQQVSLLFSRPLWLSNARTDDGYRRQALKEITARCERARSKTAPRGDVAPLVVHGQPDSKFSDVIEFRDDLDFGPNVERINTYLKKQDKKLKTVQDEIRTAAQNKQTHASKDEHVRIADELLDRVVVQRSRALCKEIESHQSSDVELLFRPDQSAPERLYYSDEYDGIKDVLAGFLPLFDTPRMSATRDEETSIQPLSLKVYMWYDVREGIRTASESSSVVGLQRILVLKRLESSPVSFLITLLRLTVLHAHRLQQLNNLCLSLGERERSKALDAALDKLLEAQETQELDKLRTLAVGDNAPNARTGFMRALSRAYVSNQPAADTDDPTIQLSLLIDKDEDAPQREQLDRLWSLHEILIADLSTLLEVAPKLAGIIFGRFSRPEWPRGFVTDGVEDSDWPSSPAWGLRIIKDAKLRTLIGRLLHARRAEQKVIVFTQFGDTIAYIRSVLRACRQFTLQEWQLVANGLGISDLKKSEITDLLDTTATITGATEDRDKAVNAFAPFYRIGPHRPEAGADEQGQLIDEWELSWRFAIQEPRHVLISTDVLAEGVNLQDVSLLINFDVHWNPVRMIQRAGRIDRRLNPAIEKAREFPELAALAAELGELTPRYYFTQHPEEAPLTVNMILPDELEAELQLRERIATKTLAIDFTLGLEQGTGAEADWMEHYRYHGTSSLNSFEKDRAIEQVAGYHERLRKGFRENGIDESWAQDVRGWFQVGASSSASPLIARVRMTWWNLAPIVFARYLEPLIADGDEYWLYSQPHSTPDLENYWVSLDKRSWPPNRTSAIPWRPFASEPVTAETLMRGALALSSQATVSQVAPTDFATKLQQGLPAIAAGASLDSDKQKDTKFDEYMVLQGETFRYPRSKER